MTDTLLCLITHPLAVITHVIGETLVRAGLRVVYEPSVLLEHLEWGSATGDSATQLMECNRAVFRNRHATWLKGQPMPQALPLDGDRWRSPEDQARRPRVLVLENEIPHLSQGGGLPSARPTD